MYKARKGMALIMALIVVLVGGAIIAFTFQFTENYSRLAQVDMAGQMDHTTLASYIQAVKARIVAQNEAAGRTLHVAALEDSDGITTPAAAPLTLAHLMFTAADFPAPNIGHPIDGLQLSHPNNPVLHVIPNSQSTANRVQVEVFDLFFRFEWLNENEIANPENFFPPVFILAGAGGGGGPDGWEDGNFTQGGRGTPPPPADVGLDMDGYGAYLIRGRLYHQRPGEEPRLLRTIEQAFVQILPQP